MDCQLYGIVIRHWKGVRSKAALRLQGNTLLDLITYHEYTLSHSLYSTRDCYSREAQISYPGNRKPQSTPTKPDQGLQGVEADIQAASHSSDAAHRSSD